MERARAGDGLLRLCCLELMPPSSAPGPFLPASCLTTGCMTETGGEGAKNRDSRRMTSALLLYAGQG